MNEEESGCCWTDRSWFNIPADEQGNNIVTGEGKKQKDYKKLFTCIDLEVFSVLYDIHPYQDPNFGSYLQRQQAAILGNQEFRSALEKKKKSQ
jgi:hypothetical protein